MRRCGEPAVMLGLLGAFCLCSPLSAKQYRVSSAAAVAAVNEKLRPGDTVVMANGEWKNQAIWFSGQGTAAKSITLRAETAGKVVLEGKSSLTVTGENVVVSGLCFKNGREATNGILLEGHRCRLTDTAVINGTYKFFLHLAGVENRVDHCYLAGKTSESPTLQVEVGSEPNHHRIDHNWFGHRAPLGRNGGETMRVGYSWQSMSNSATVVEENLFERCDGEIEIISSKSCENVYRRNTFLDCAGMLTLRHGNRCVVENNFFIAHHTRGSGGIRVIGEGHKIINNYIDGVWQGGIWITAGIVDSPLIGYFQAKNILVTSNTMVNCRGPCLDLNAGFGSSGRTLIPEKVVITKNLFSVPKDGELIKGTEGAGYKWGGNVVLAESVGASAITPAVLKQTGARVVEMSVQRRADGLWQPNPPKKRSGSEIGAGCDFAGFGSKLNRPLTGAEVGPAWMKGREPKS